LRRRKKREKRRDTYPLYLDIDKTKGKLDAYENVNCEV